MIMTRRKESKFPLRNVGGSIQKTASTLFSSDWDGKPHGVGYLAAGADMNKGEKFGSFRDYKNKERMQ
ncbi:MAG: hypothetical protein CL778_04720 [Chloroflexi bacterium]|nr:hypothetical protein [Chloroflexota bacterium]